ncbi:predicted protein [Histoplasma mississippiense (nom. inval.)]|uniref:predicted protein n=1 Tax=Ajellomyces capsulatus (strain NAm1 / WU24) TaxID=2059318 RepID=UPI000157BDA5|nr:predicted protein [Histoplasma mississippiense (nom. inval.)]EDN06296.1 predicted protein [Histoplasma mississippiense (nom. inval.)]
MVVLHFGRGLKISWNPPIGIHSSIPRRGSVMEWNAKLLPDIGFGFNHMIRIVEFSDKTRWVARLRMPPLLQRGNCPHEMTRAMECEHHIIQLIRKETNMPVPQIHVFDGNLQKKVKAQFMLMARFTKVVFGLPEDKIKESAGQFADRLIASASLFKSAINNIAENISIHNNRAFSLYHGNFRHNNIIFDDKHRLLGIIDWEAAVAGTCEITGEFP